MSYQSPKVTMYDISGNPVTNIGADNSTNSTAKIPVIAARANTSAPSWTDGYMVPLSTDTSGALRITGTITATNASTSATGSAPPASATYIGGSVTTAAPTYTTGTMNALSLTTTGLLRIDGSGVTQPISAVSLPLPTGAATETTLGGVLTTTAFQARINTLGQKTMANSTPVVLSSDQSAIPVTGTFFQATQPVSGTVTANIGTTGGLATEATLDNLTIAQSAALGSNTQAMVGGSVTTAAPTYTTGNINPLSLTIAGALRVDGSATTQPVSGTVTANAGTGNFTVVQATASNLNATVVGTTAAGSGASSGLVTIQGNASGTPVPVSGTVTATNPSVSTTGASPPASATYIGGSVTTAAPAYTTGQMSALSLTTGGLLRVDGSGVTQPVSGTVTANQGGTWTVQPGNTANTTAWLVAGGKTNNNAAPGATNFGVLPGLANASAPTWTEGNQVALSTLLTGALRIDVTSWLGSTVPTVGSKTSANSIPVVVASDQGAITVNASATVGLVDNAAFTDGTTRVQPTGYILDEVAGTALTENDVAAARVDSKRAQVFVIEDTTTRGTRTTVKAASTAAATADTALVVSMAGANSATKIGDGTNSAAIKAASTAAAATDPALVVAISPNNTVAATQSGTWTVQPGNTANTTAWLVAGGKTNNNAAPGATNLGALVGLANAAAPTWTEGNQVALSTNLTGDLRSLAKVTDGTNTAAVKAASTAPLATDPALVVTMSPNASKLGITGTVKPLYGTNNQAMTITLASLANNGDRASTAVDNTTSLFEDVYIFVKVTTAAAGVSTTGYVNIYAYGTVDGGTTYPEGITGTDAGVTLTAPPNLVLIGQINANTNGATKTFGPISFCRNYGMDRLPARWGIVIENKTGATFNATAGNFAVTYQGVNGQLT